MDEDARDFRVGGGAADEFGVGFGPDLRIDFLAALDDGNGRHLFALFAGQHAVGHGSEPDVGVEADLMAGMAGEHRAAARLGKVADQQARPAVLRPGFDRQAFDEFDEIRVAPVAVAAEAHGLPGRTGFGQFDAAGEAAFGVKSDGAGFERGCDFLGAEQLFGRHLGDLPFGELFSACRGLCGRQTGPGGQAGTQDEAANG